MALALMKGEIGKPVRRLIPEPFQGSFGRNRHPMQDMANEIQQILTGI